MPLGSSLDTVMGDVWVIVSRVASASPSAFVLLPSEVREHALRNEKDGRESWWLEPRHSEQEPFRDAWGRIGRGGD